MKTLQNNPIARSFAATLVALTVATPAIASPEIAHQSAETTRNAPITLAEGIHLYGESVNPNEIGKSYAILEVKAGQITGAFYQPRSSFDCFRGATKEGQLALNITDSYTGETFPYAIALENTSLVASVGDIPTNKPGLEGFYPIEEISDRDRELLQTCQAQ
ncbi:MULTISPECIES: hypothetical protein [Spirulina sp. CCY15215]|uniref:hypothetical protein n=1 Tax=Spirulina sp. CCY15215 TaxID=2767591 RepID=UPI0019505943|nr:hypothetical protein [Spirulina major]